MQDCNFESKDVLAYIFRKCAEFGFEVSITKGQKLLYCCYGLLLASDNARLCSEHPACWTYGPVFPSSYKAWREGKLDFSNKTIKAIESNEHLKDVMESALKYFGKASASKLIAWTHLPNSPWALCSNNGRHLYRDIDDVLIRDCFLPFIKR